MKEHLSGKTQIYGVIGDPVEHSLSPVMHNAAFKALKVDGVFLAFKVKKMEVKSAIEGMRALGICGFNVTMPHKNAVIPYLDEVDETSELLGSVNTILNDNGKLRGVSTDGVGALRALQENNVAVKGRKVVLLGGGGAGKAIAYTLAKEVDQLILLNRTTEKIRNLSKDIDRVFHKEITVDILSSKTLETNLKDADILINATNVGMHPNSAESIVNSRFLKPELAVMDIVYNPIETKLAKDAKDAGARVVNGLEMLVYQGAASFELWIGKIAPVKVMRQAALNQLQQRVKKNAGAS